MLRTVDTQLGPRAIRCLTALIAGIVLLGAGVASTHRPVPRPVTTALLVDVETPLPDPVPTRAPVTPVVRPRPAAPPKAVKVIKKKAVAKKPVVRWLPTGTGMWLHEFEQSEGGNAKAVVARAKAVGLTTLYVQTGSSGKGWIGSSTLSKLLPQTRGTDIKVVAWDFPNLRNPVADAIRMAGAIKYTCKGCPRVAAVAPDVETAAEGTRIGVAQVTLYYKALRQHLPANVAILATVPWPSESRVGRYPYQRTSSLTDALMPMAYWYNRSPAGVTAASMSYLKRFHRPILPIGQGYDGRLDAPYIAADPHPGESVKAFLLQAHRAGARAVSLWSWQTAGGQQWAALKKGRTLFRR